MCCVAPREHRQGGWRNETGRLKERGGFAPRWHGFKRPLGGRDNINTTLLAANRCCHWRWQCDSVPAPPFQVNGSSLPFMWKSQSTLSVSRERCTAVPAEPSWRCRCRCSLQWWFNMSHQFSFEAEIWGTVNHRFCTVQAQGCPQVCEQPEEPAGPPQTAAQTSLGISLPSTWRGCHGHVSRLERRTEKNPTGQESSQRDGFDLSQCCHQPQTLLCSPRTCQRFPWHSAVQVQSTTNPIQTDANQFFFLPVNGY